MIQISRQMCIVATLFGVGCTNSARESCFVYADSYNREREACGESDAVLEPQEVCPDDIPATDDRQAYYECLSELPECIDGEFSASGTEECDALLEPLPR